MEEIEAAPATHSTRRRFAPAAIMGATATIIIVGAMIIHTTTAFGTPTAQPVAATNGTSTSAGSGSGTGPTAVPAAVASPVVGFGAPDSGAGADLSMLAGKKIVSIAGSLSSTTFLTTDGHLFQATGGGVTDISSKAVHPTAIAAGLRFTAILNGDGTVSVQNEGVLNESLGASGPISVNISGATAIAASDTQIIALHADGTVSTASVFGPHDPSLIAVPAGLSGVTAIAAGSSNFGAIVAGHVVTWGTDSGAQPAAMNGVKVVALAAGDRTFLALGSNGQAYAWGSRWTPQSTLPAAIAGRTDIVQIASGSAHALVLTKTGQVLAFGLSNLNQATVPAGLATVSLIGAGDRSSWTVAGPLATAAAAQPTAAPALATTSTANAALKSWALGEVAGDPAAQAVIAQTGMPTSSVGETVTGIGIHPGETTPAPGMTCLRADISGTAPSALGGHVSDSWDVLIDGRDPAHVAVVWAQGWATSTSPICPTTIPTTK